MAAAAVLAPAVSAATTIDQRGTQVQVDGVAAADGQQFGSLRFSGSADPTPFDVLLGIDSQQNFSASWTHSYGALSGTVSSAFLQIGIWDIDSEAAGSQVGLLTLNGLSLKALLDREVESRPYGTGIYGLYTIELPELVYAQLLSGTSTFVLNLQGPGINVLGGTNFNAAILDFAKLTINTATTPPGPDPIPEPASWAMMIAGFGLAGTALRRRRPVLRTA
ncbi:PEPxxWA-CTERM sorting domain-containing protein [Sphingomonas changnyeongensis]|uniref:PEPxxWA-CTERM sorting domain-containing protein n=2 Tax=Sphingomonas changnyeongensis TaxID=2698679 RepID=A0A7Z2NXN6_9SPHN|nr:PEPxxWA-CTERM sorting domain-containing protein [Sphingomonas changnyeongensis]